MTPQDSKSRRYHTALKPSLGLGLLCCLFLFMLIIVSMVVLWITSRIGTSATALRISTVAQDLLVFILPALVTAMMVTRLPAEFLELMKKPKAAGAMLAIAVMLAAIPAMNLIIEWNASWQLPPSMEWMKESEANAEATLNTLMGPATIGNLLISLLIVGALTGVAEEMFFRGALQKLLLCTRINPHAAIWIAAAIFSAIHFQVYGFVPRMLLGAFFGYLMWWSGSLWLPILAHAFNNSVVVVARWIKETSAFDLDSIGTSASPDVAIAVTLSAVLTVALIIVLRKAVIDQSSTGTCPRQ